MVLVLYMMEISPPCRAVMMTAKYLGLEVELREANLIVGNYNRLSEFSKINPRSCVPTIDDDGFFLCESRAIMTYFVNKYAPSNSIYPKDPRKRAVVDMMLNFDQGTFYRSTVKYLYPMVFCGESSDSSKELKYRSSLMYLDHLLDQNAYVAGKNLTLADFSIVASVSMAEVYDFNFRNFPNIVDWLKRLKKELPFYREVNEYPLLQFKFWYRPNLKMNKEDPDELDIDTKM